MKHTLLMVPVGSGTGLTSVSMGLTQALENHGIETFYLNPFTEDELNIERVEHLLGQGEEESILASIICHIENRAIRDGVIVVQGMISSQMHSYASSLNYEIFKALDAEVIFVVAPGGNSPKELKEQINIAARPYGEIGHSKLIGCMINKVGAPVDKYGNTWVDLFDPPEDSDKAYAFGHVFDIPTFKTLGCFPWKRDLIAPRVKDVADYLDAEIISSGRLYENRVRLFAMAGATIENATSSFKPNVMIITPADRCDIIVATCLSYLNGINIAGILLTGGYEVSQSTMRLCYRAIEQGLPILSVKTDSLCTACSLKNINIGTPKDDVERNANVREFIASYIDQCWIKQLVLTHVEHNLSPPAFRYQLIEQACKARKQIVLPEGEEPRIIRAAVQCVERGVARPLLLGNPTRITQIADNNGITLHPNITIIDPDPIREGYLELLLELRKHKSLTRQYALEALHSNIVVGTLMLAKGEVDGLVSGANHTTAETVRPALMLIKTREDVKRASSIFFMCIPKQVLVYGDCAINKDPTAEELANIAIQSADSAEHFGIPARVAMISYSTGRSGKGSSVDKVKRATQMVKASRPDIIVDGPLQYDAAFSVDVANKKARGSPVAGRATVYIFPDLNTGNTTYKAVQRSGAGVISIGPILQGLNKPVNDVSRGARIDDIFYTIAITAIQASKK